MTLLSLDLRFLLAFVFLAASIPKLAAPDDFRHAVVGYALVPNRFAEPIAFWLPRVELVLAGALFAGVALPVAVLVAAALLVATAAVIAVNLARGRTIDCGCFGHSAPRQISWSLVVQDVGLAVAGGLVAIHPAGFQLIDLGPSAAYVTASDTVATGVAAAATLVAVGLVGALRRVQPALDAFATTKQLSS